MLWTESHVELRTHPKTRRLVRLLKVSLPQTIGHLHCLWWWTMEYAPDGNLSKFHHDDIAIGAEWEGEPEELITALVTVRFLDPNMRIHNWDLYGGKLYARKEANAARMRDARHARVQRTCNAQDDTCIARAEPEYSTVQESTGTSLIRDVSTSVSPPKPPTKIQPDPRIQVLYEYYKEKIFPMSRKHDPKRIAARLKDWTEDEIRLAIDHFSEDEEFWMTHCASKGADWFFGNAKHFEEWVSMKPRKGNGHGTRQPRHTVSDETAAYIRDIEANQPA